MAESSWEKQLQRIRQLSEQMSRVATHAAELSNELARGREQSQHGPLHEVRDLRTYPIRNDSPRRSHDEPGNARREKARDSSRRHR